MRGVLYGQVARGLFYMQHDCSQVGLTSPECTYGLSRGLNGRVLARNCCMPLQIFRGHAYDTCAIVEFKSSCTVAGDVYPQVF